MAGSGYREVLEAPAYRGLLSAALVSRSGDAVQVVALALFVYGVTGSPAAVALLVVAESVGLVAGAVVAQLVVDAVPPRPLLVGLDLLRAAAVVVLVAVTTVPVAVAVAALLAVGTACFSPASVALIPRLVEDRLLPAANTLQWAAGVALQIALAPLAGLLVAAASARAAFAVNAVSFAVSALVLRGTLPPLERAAASERLAWWRRLGAGIRLAQAERVMAPLLAMQALAALSVGATSALLVVLAEGGYALGPTGYGAWLGVIGAGALAGPFVVPRLLGLAEEHLVSAAYVVRGAGDLLLTGLRSGPLAASVLGVYGLCTSSGMVAYQTLVQRRLPEAARGRALALLDGTWQLCRLLSIGAGGLAAGAVGIRPVYAVGGLLLAGAGLVGLTALRPA